MLKRLEKRLASPEIREHTLQRFDKDITELEAYRRGPGSYDCACACGKKTSSSKANDGGYENSEAVSCIRTGCFQQSPLPSIRHKQSSSFGRVASRDLLTSMIAAGHASGHTIGPGVYDAYSSSVILQTHNLGYKQEMKRTESKAKRQIRVGSADRDEDIRAGPKLSHKEMWKIMKQRPTLLS
ncbi:unnamed protein product [Phytophthora lilii]|uniref:Unnamed protein product n=1 Tax=Phytophthora lilii TaxID=2077276 RepID=A0A9W6WW09_9STRA|nr:unnamed protein product [Phytophthora lilii]